METANYYLVVMIVDNPEDCSAVLDAWTEIGVAGVTILESTGLARHQKSRMEDNFPLMPSLRDFLQAREEPHRTLFSVVDSLETVDRMVEAAQRITGNLNDPHTGFLFVTPVLRAYGLSRKSTT